MKKALVTLGVLVGTLAGSAAAHEGHVFDGLVPGGTSSPLAPQDDVVYVTGDTGFPGGHVAREGDRLYLGSYTRGFRIYDVSAPASPRFLGEYVPGGVVADAPPDAAVFDGRHIAVLNGTNRTSPSIPATAGRTDHTYFVDVTDPAAPRLLWKFDGVVSRADGESHNGDIVDARRLYLPSGLGGVNGLRIYDLNPLLQTPAQAPRIISRTDPVRLWDSSPYRRDRDIGPLQYTHTHDIEVYLDYPVAGLGLRDIAFVAEGGNYLNGNNAGSMFVIDITDPAKPVALQRWLHKNEPGTGHHPIRYHHEVQLLQGDPRVALITDEDLHNGCDAGGVTAIRLSDDLTEATELSEWFIGTGTPAAVCSVHVFSTHGNLMFIGSYNAGLQVVDYSDPASPRKVGFHIAPGTTAWGALYAGDGIVWVGDMARGLDVFRYEGPQPDLTVTSVEGFTGSIRATVANLGGVKASDVLVRFDDNGALVGEQTVTLAAGESAELSVPWSTKKLKGERTLTATADPAGAIDESNEGNNSASRSVTVRGNKVRNGDFSEPGPAGWTASGDTASDGQSVSAGPGGAWTSDPITIEPLRTYGFSVSTLGSGTAVVEQLSALGAVISAAPAVGLVTPVSGATSVRIRLQGGLTGVTTFDDVWLWEE